jgi:coproporphyrinogen III oxidase-like Fe-S oxidoreductase
MDNDSGAYLVENNPIDDNLGEVDSKMGQDHPSQSLCDQIAESDVSDAGSPAEQRRGKTCLVNVCVPYTIGRCDYYGRPLRSGVAPDEKRAYFRALADEAKGIGTELAERRAVVDALTLGTGSIGTVEPSVMRELAGSLRSSLPLARGAFVTAEADPGLLSTALLDELKAFGITMLRIHYLTTDEASLSRMERPDTEIELKKTRIVLDSAAFHHLDMQVLVGLRGQDRKAFERTLRAALLVEGVEHVTLIPAAGAFAASYDQLAGDCALAFDLLDAHGFAAYTPRCFARAAEGGRAPEASLRLPEEDRLFRTDDVVGIGAAAISCYDGLMWQNVADPSEYVAARGDLGALTAQALEMGEAFVEARQVFDALYHLGCVPVGRIDAAADGVRGTLVGAPKAAGTGDALRGEHRDLPAISERLLEDGLLEEAPCPAPSPSPERAEGGAGACDGERFARLSTSGRASYDKVFARILGA